MDKIQNVEKVDLDPQVKLAFGQFILEKEYYNINLSFSGTFPFTFSFVFASFRLSIFFATSGWVYCRSSRS